MKGPTGRWVKERVAQGGQQPVLALAAEEPAEFDGAVGFDQDGVDLAPASPTVDVVSDIAHVRPVEARAPADWADPCKDVAVLSVD